MELACNPLNGELLGQQHGCTQEYRKQELQHEIDNVDIISGRIILLPALDEGLERNPDSERPAGKRNISGRIR